MSEIDENFLFLFDLYFEEKIQIQDFYQESESIKDIFEMKNGVIINISLNGDDKYCENEEE